MNMKIMRVFALFGLTISLVLGPTTAKGKVYKGLIVSTKVNPGLLIANGGQYLSRWVQAAGKAGLNWLVLAIPAKRMNAIKWQLFENFCKKASNKTFLLLPAVEFKQPYNASNYYSITINPQKWIPIDKKNWWNTYWNLLTQAHATTVLSQPWKTVWPESKSVIQGTETVTIWQHAPWGEPNILRNSLWLNYNWRGFRISPVVVWRGNSATALSAPWWMGVWGKKLSSVPRQIHNGWYITDYISDGPTIKKFNITYKNQIIGGPGGYSQRNYGDTICWC